MTAQATGPTVTRFAADRLCRRVPPGEPEPSILQALANLAYDRFVTTESIAEASHLNVGRPRYGPTCVVVDPQAKLAPAADLVDRTPQGFERCAERLKRRLYRYLPRHRTTSLVRPGRHCAGCADLDPVRLGRSMSSVTLLGSSSTLVIGTVRPIGQ